MTKITENLTAKHTPGPWVISRNMDNDDLVVRRPDDGVVANLKCNYFESEKHSQEIEANARLIAAAPDLLDAAIGILSILDFFDKNQLHTKELLIEEGEKLRAAIAKTTA